jgi:hypothetical protein
MKVIIEESGLLVITPETGIECYALRHWIKENVEEDEFGIQKPRNIRIEASRLKTTYPDEDL